MERVVFIALGTWAAIMLLLSAIGANADVIVPWLMLGGLLSFGLAVVASADAICRYRQKLRLGRRDAPSSRQVPMILTT